MIVLAAALLQAASSFPPDLHETTRNQVGAFVIEHERHENRGIPIMHAPLQWQKVRLIFVMEDDGQQVQLSATVTVDGKPVCTASGPLTAYGKQPGTTATWLAGFRGMAAMVEGCGATERAIVAAERDAYDAAAPDFPAASRLMRTEAVTAFGNTATRCLEFDPRHATVPYYVPCARWSDGRKRD